MTNFRPFDGSMLEQTLTLQQTVLELQESFNIQLKMKQVCHVLLGRKPPKRGQKVDNRSYRISEGFVETLRAMLGMFKVTDKLKWAYFPERFNQDGWRKTSYAEIRKIRSQSQTALSDDIIKRSLKTLEAMGVIERHSPWMAWLKRRSLEIRFNADKLIEILRGLGEEAQSQNPCVLPIKATGDSMVIYPPSSTIEKEQPASGSGVFSEKEKSLPAGRDLLSEKKVSSELYAIWQVLKPHFPQNQVLTDKQLRLLERRVKDPIAKNQLTLERARFFGKQLTENYDKSKWFLTRDLDVFLRFWTGIQRRLAGEKVTVAGFDAITTLRDLSKEKVLEDFNNRVQDLGEELMHRYGTMLDLADKTQEVIDAEDMIFECGMSTPEPLVIVEVAKLLKLDMRKIYSRLEAVIWSKLKAGALYYMRLAESLPIFSWVVLTGAEFMELFSIAQDQYNQLIRAQALYYRYPSCQ